MRNIIPLELVGLSSVDFDIYDEKGELLYKSGDALTPGLLMQLSQKTIFAAEKRKVSAQDEITDVPFIQTHSSYKHKPVLSEKVTKILVNNTKNLVRKVYNNETLDTEACIDTAEIIAEEVSGKLERIECISQLRIFDEYTFSHTINVSTMSSAIGMILDQGEEQIKELVLGALLHDIGKMRVPKEILNKPARLEPEELTIMRSHSLLGYKYIVEKMDVPDVVAKVALDHQERYKGSGYPNGLKGKEINLYAQITAVADVYDALISNRVYKRAFEPAKAIDIMIEEAEESFNPYIFNKFLKLAGSERTVVL